MFEGICVGWSERGFGFIRPAEGGADIFVHAKEITNRDVLNHGDKVTFDSVFDDRRGKLQARNVRVL
ncbi:cold shock CspA family protein [Bradyrhizobium sp. JR4.1]|uniref:cold shock domain-containing protein n=1 Tax=Bradyrhizobium sp. JR4.1 TaxID=3156372 RepID=UPI003396A4CB